MARIKMMTVNDVCEDLSIDRLAVFQLINRHGLPAHRWGGKWNIDGDMYRMWKIREEREFPPWVEVGK